MIWIYSDGGSHPCGPDLPRAAGWGAVIVRDGVQLATAGAPCVGRTNNEAELLGAIEGIKHAMRFAAPAYTLVTDSQYVINVCRPAAQLSKNAELVGILRSLVNAYRVKLEWIKGHSGNQWNDIADGIATDGRKEAKRLITGG